MKNIISILFFVSTFLQAQSEIQQILKNTATKFGEKNVIEYQVHSTDGSESQFIKEFDYDVPFPDVKILGSGNIIFINSFEASIELLDINGMSLKKIYLSNKKIEYERSIFSAVDNDLIVLSLNESSEYFHQNFIVNQELDIVASSEKSNGLIGALVFANKYKKIFASTIKYENYLIIKNIEVLDTSLKSVSVFQGEFNNYFFDDLNGQILLYNSQEVNCINLANSSSLCKIKSNKHFISAKILDKEIIILQTDKPFFENNKWLYSSCQINKYSTDGNLLSSKILNVEFFREVEWINNKTIRIDRTNYKIE